MLALGFFENQVWGALHKAWKGASHKAWKGASFKSCSMTSSILERDVGK
jgi:hypothetical protein